MDWRKINFKKLAKFLPIIGLILFVYMIYAIGAEKIANTFASIPLHIYVLAFIPSIVRVFLSALKSQYIAKKQKISLPFVEYTKIVLMSIFYGIIIPGGIGWHIKVFYLSRKAKVPIEKCITNSLLDASTSSLTGQSIAIIGSIILIDKYPGVPLVLIPAYIFLFLLFIIFVKKNQGSKIFKFVIKTLIPKKYREKLGKSVDNLYEDMPRFRDLIIPFIYEVAIWIIVGTQVYIIAQALNIPVEYHIFLLIHTISVVIVGLMPISVGGIGIREGALVFLLSAFGVEAQIAFVISLSGFFVKMIVPAIAGMLISLRKENAIFLEKKDLI